MNTLSPRIRTAVTALAVSSLLAVVAAGCSKENAPAPEAKKEAPAAATVTGVAWKGYEEGLAEAKASNKPVCLIFYTDWCPHCKNYHKVFEDPKVIELSRKFVMIHINKDQDAATSAKYAPDGDYIPRTFFLKPDGTLLEQITEQRDKYRYFYDEKDPASVMRSMDATLKLVAAG